ncbi:hypothetical protein [Kribbella antibiotica]|uniref:hypothetical protein n=1 Tax=Kribbella antibiotica TaxID=190195 RepID=UPI0014043F8A|nr:hypothetical protein [Kribbella antibiotica]
MKTAGSVNLGGYQPAEPNELEAFPALIADLAQAHDLTVGLATVTTDPHLN